MLILVLDGAESLGRCFASPKMNAASEKFASWSFSTSELQNAALAFYKNAGYHLVYEDLAQTGSNKTVGSGIRRFYFEKSL
jgi:hypothetical protein